MRKVLTFTIGALAAGALLAACEGTYAAGYYDPSPVYGGAYDAYPYGPYGYYGYPGYRLGYARPYGLHERHEALEHRHEAFEHRYAPHGFTRGPEVRPPEHRRF